MATSYNRQCSICLEDFNQPKFLDCHHTFCLECLRDLENKTPGIINCPLCQRKVQLPSGGVDKLTTNFYIQDTPLVGVESAETVPRGLSSYSGAESLQRGAESLQTGDMSQQQRGNQAKTYKTEQKAQVLIKMVYNQTHKCGNHTQSIDGILFDFQLKESEFLILSIELSKKHELIHSCNIDYDITFINQKDAECSVRATGKAYLQSSQGYPYELKTVRLYLIRRGDAFDTSNRFIVNKSEDRPNLTFQLSVGIIVSNIKKINFSLN